LTTLARVIALTLYVKMLSVTLVLGQTHSALCGYGMLVKTKGLTLKCSIYKCITN